MAPRLNLKEFNGFPNDFDESGKIETLTFLEASNEVIGFIDSFGKLFSPVSFLPK